MYKFKNNFLYYISQSQDITYILDCRTNKIVEIDSIGTALIKELLETKSENKAKEILDLFEGCDFFEKSGTK